MSVCLFVCLCVCLSAVCLSLCMSVRLPICLYSYFADIEEEQDRVQRLDHSSTDLKIYGRYLALPFPLSLSPYLMEQCLSPYLMEQCYSLFSDNFTVGTSAMLQ